MQHIPAVDIKKNPSFCHTNSGPLNLQYVHHGYGIRPATPRGMHVYIYSMHLRKIGLYSQVCGLGPELNAISNPETFMVRVQPTGFLRNWYQPN
jgi:hypothetical protein